VKLLTFSESFVPGYPWWNWWASTFDIESNDRIGQLFALNSPMIGTDDLAPVFAAAKEAGVNVVLPVTERDNQGEIFAVLPALLSTYQTATEGAGREGGGLEVPPLRYMLCASVCVWCILSACPAVPQPRRFLIARTSPRDRDAESSRSVCILWETWELT
jgi:hypothetical protein